MIFSACSARLQSLLSGTRLQMLLPSEFSETDCVSWGAAVRTASSSHSVAAKIAPILNRLEAEPVFAVQELRWSAATFGIIAFTSSVEYFLQDLVSLCLRRSSSLRKKAFAQYQIPAKNLEEFQTVDQIKLRHIEILSNENTSGSLFSEKFKKTIRFLDITTVTLSNDLKESLDSIWKLRNRFAHENHGKISKMVVVRSGGDLVLSRDRISDDYRTFALDLCEVFGIAVQFLEDVDRASLASWTADAFITDK